MNWHSAMVVDPAPKHEFPRIGRRQSSMHRSRRVSTKINCVCLCPKAHGPLPDSKEYAKAKPRPSWAASKSRRLRSGPVLVFAEHVRDQIHSSPSNFCTLFGGDCIHQIVTQTPQPGNICRATDGVIDRLNARAAKFINGIQHGSTNGGHHFITGRKRIICRLQLRPLHPSDHYPTSVHLGNSVLKVHCSRGNPASLRTFCA